MVPSAVPSRAAMLGIGLASHEQRLPGDRIIRSTRHGEQVVGTVFEQHLRNHAGGQDGGKHIERGALGPDAVEPRVPLHRDAQTLATLLDHDGRPPGNLDAQDNVGNPAGQLLDHDGRVPGRPAGFAKIKSGVFRVQFPHGGEFRRVVGGRAEGHFEFKFKGGFPAGA